MRNTPIWLPPRISGGGGREDEDREGGPKLIGPDDKEFDINRNGVSDWEEFDISLTVNGESNDKFEEYIMEDYDDIELIFVSK